MSTRGGGLATPGAPGGHGLGGGGALLAQRAPGGSVGAARGRRPRVQRGPDPVATLQTFHATSLRLIELDPGNTYLDGQRKTMPLAQFKSALEKQRDSVLAYLASISDAELQNRKARIPLFKQIMQQEEI